MCNEKEYLHILLDVVLSGIFFAWSLVFLFWPMRMYWFLWNFGRLIPPYGQQQDSMELLRGPKSIQIYHLKSKKYINNGLKLRETCVGLAPFYLNLCLLVLLHRMIRISSLRNTRNHSLYQNHKEYFRNGRKCTPKSYILMKMWFFMGWSNWIIRRSKEQLVSYVL